MERHPRIGMAAVVLVVGLTICRGDEQKFPYREKYPQVPAISTEELVAKQNAGEAVIVDVRSQIEFDVIHPVGAVHIPISHISFLEKVGELIAENPGKAIAFYCNGVTCLKSYEAAEKALEAGYKNCFVYDAGIPEWSMVRPERTLLLGQIITDPQQQLIPEENFKKRCLSFDEFKAKAAAAEALVIDVRDHIQTSGKLPGLEDAMVEPLDRFIPKFVEKKLHQDKELLIFDQVGKQVQWLQYYLVANGYSAYSFLQGGATAVLEKQQYK